MQAAVLFLLHEPPLFCRSAVDSVKCCARSYIAGVFCAVVSQPADNLVSKLNAVKGSTVGGLIKVRSPHPSPVFAPLQRACCMTAREPSCWFSEHVTVLQCAGDRLGEAVHQRPAAAYRHGRVSKT